MGIRYKVNVPISAKEFAEVLDASGIRRPTQDIKRIQAMLDHGNLLVTAWEGGILVGVARSLADFSFCCYLSDLAVRKTHQKLGIGKKMVEITREMAGEDSMLLLLSAPEAMEYYPKLEMDEVKNGFIYPRKKV
ncbi:MAG: GNAT family N-acetyltransferase [Bacteroidia bacterium]|nr:GNAT family N-acetyltransferase [Bacteroidia bacterium]